MVSSLTPLNHHSLSVIPLPLPQSTPIPSSLHPGFSSPCHPSLPQRATGAKSLCATRKGRGSPEKEKQARLSWQKRSHFWPKLFCDLSLATMLALEQVSVTNDLKGTKECRNKWCYQAREVPIAKIILIISVVKTPSSVSMVKISLKLNHQINWNLREDNVDLFWPSWLRSTKAWTLSTAQAPSWKYMYP